MPKGAMTAVVAKSNSLQKRRVQPQGASDRASHLGYLESVGEPGALMILGKDKDLRLAS
jgi:hypothetical protein